MSTPVVIGIISDTHGLLRPEAVAALRGSERIIHAGDVGAHEILDQLAAIAPVTAVRGNVDRETWARKLPQIEVIEIGGVSIYVLHDLGQLDLKPEASGFDVVISGHSHIPKQETQRGALFQSRQRGTAALQVADQPGKVDRGAGNGSRRARYDFRLTPEL